MKIAVQPISVPHESILAIKLHMEVLTAEYTRLVKEDRGKKINETNKAMQTLRDKMSDCKKAEEVLNKWLEDTTKSNTDEHTSENETLQGDGQG